MRLIRSELGLRAVLALRQSGPAHLAELARTLGVRTSSLQRAVEILCGDAAVGLPDRSRPGRRGGVLLGRVSPDLRLPPPRLLRTMKRRHGVRALRVFGSAVRSDFRPDSDVDVAVELAAGTARR